MLELTLSFEKDTYTAGEPIACKFTLRNNGTSPLVVNGRLTLNAPFAPKNFREVALTVTDPAGSALDFMARVNVGAPKAGHFKTLGPGETVEHVYELQKYYRLDKGGKYSVQAVYQNQSDPGDGAAAWKGELKSNAAAFTLRS